MPEPEPISYTYTFDDDGRLATMTDPSGHVTTYSRDGTEIGPDAGGYPGRVTTYTYDADGCLVQVQDPEEQ